MRSPSPSDLLATRLEQAPPGPLAVAFSGGGDSTALLDALAALPTARARGLRALHVDHGLHPDAATWASRAEALARGLGVTFVLLRVEVPRDSGLGLEAAARQARYDALAAAMRDDELLCTAHHRRDQAETFLMRALRASGPDGLGAMRGLRRFGPGWLWRPWLDVPPDAVEAYRAARRLPAIEDPANADPRHDRSWLRVELMPRLRPRWPDAEAALATSAALCAQAADAMHAQDMGLLARLRGLDPSTLSATGLVLHSPATRARVLRAWLASLGLPPLPGLAHGSVDRELLGCRWDAEPSFSWHGARLQRWRDLLHASWQPAPSASTARAWDGTAPLALPCGGTLALEGPTPPRPFDPPLASASRRGGERIQLPARTHASRLKERLQAMGVPPWERERLPLLFASDGALEAVGDLLVSARLAQALADRGARLRWVPGAGRHASPRPAGP